MSSIAGFFQPNTVYSKENEFCIRVIHDMSQALFHRGPDEQSFYYFPHGAFNHHYLLSGYIPGTFSHKMQPITVSWQGNTYTLLLDGFVSNPVAKIMPITHDFNPCKTTLKYLFLVRFFKITVISKITQKEGSTTPAVAATAPKKPPWIFPT